MIRIALSGPAHSGKSTAALYLCDHFGFQRVSFSTPLKRMVARNRGVTLAYLEQNKQNFREELQTLGHGMRQSNPDYWVEMLDRELSATYYRNDTPLVLDDLRYTNEAKYLKNNKWYLVRIAISPDALNERRKRLNISGGEWANHVTEHYLDGYDDWDYVIPAEYPIREYEWCVGQMFAYLLDDYYSTKWWEQRKGI